MRTKKYIETRLPSLEGKTYVVTGANSGLGFQASKILASKGARVFLACRSEKRANEAIEKIKKEVKNAKLEFIEYDQSDYEKITSFCQNLAKLNIKIDGFVANAGVYFPPKEKKTKLGYPLTFGVNFVGVYILIRNLINEDVFNSHPTRFVFVGSVAKALAYPKTFDKWFYDDRVNRNFQYSYSKAGIILLSTYLMNEDLNNVPEMKFPSNVEVYYTHPGITNTNIVRSNEGGFGKNFVKVAQNFLKIFFQSPERASLTMVKALTTEKSGKNISIRPRGPFEISGLPQPRKMNKINKIAAPRFMDYVENELSKKSI